MTKMTAVLVDMMGSDLTVANAARVSFGKHSNVLNNNDSKLITFLAKHGHWSPFAHVQLQFRIKAPLFVARQLGKHQVGLTWNEISRRYVDTDIEFYEPTVWRKAADNVKQGSSSEAIDNRYMVGKLYKAMTESALEDYNHLMLEGVCMEQARMLLPQAMMTEWYWTGSLVAFARIVEQRTHSTAQRETSEIALMIDECINNMDQLTHSWSALTKGNK